MQAKIAAGLTLAVLALAPQIITAQVAPDAQRSSRGWKSDWLLSLTTAYDDNAFRLTRGQQNDLDAGIARYDDMSSPQDFVHTLEVGGEWRRPGLGGKTLALGIGARGQLYSRSPRQSSVRLDASVEQRLSRRDEIGLRVAFTPSEFRRNYLAGADLSGQPVYGAGIAHTLDGNLDYARELVRGRGANPDVDLELGVRAGIRRYPDFPWRDRDELGAALGIGVDFGRIDLDLRGALVRAGHGGEPEPVAGDLGVVTASLDRDYDELQLGAGVDTRLSRRVDLKLSYQRRQRSYLASLAEDPVYGDREDRRNRYAAELRIGRKRLAFLLGGVVERQSTFRPGRGDTGDEQDYERLVTHLGFEYRR